MATEEELEIAIKTEKAKAALGDLEKELERLREKNGELTLGGLAGAAGSALQGAAGQTGAAVGSFAGSSPIDKIATLMEVLVTQLAPTMVGKLDVMSQMQGIEGRIGPAAETLARLTGQQVPNDVLEAMGAQAAGPERQARIARARVHAIARSAMADDMVDGYFDASDMNNPRWQHLEQLRKFYEANNLGRWLGH